MSAVAARGSGFAFVVAAAATLAVIGMIVVAVLHAQIRQSTSLDVLIAGSFVASFVGAIGGLLLANRRRNVMWILAVSVSMTAMLALLATVIASFGPN